MTLLGIAAMASARLAERARVERGAIGMLIIGIVIGIGLVVFGIIKLLIPGE